MATASASGIEWLTAKNSSANGPSCARLLLGHLAQHRRDAVLAQLGREQREGEAAADDRDVGALAQQVRHGAEVVLVAVGEDDGLDVVEPVPDVGEVREDQVDAGLVVLGEQHAAVDDEQPAGVLEDGHVAADLAQPAERDDAQAAVGERRRRAELGVRVAHATRVEALSGDAGGSRSARSTAICSGVASTSGRRTGPAGRPSSGERGLDQDRRPACGRRRCRRAAAARASRGRGRRRRRGTPRPCRAVPARDEVAGRRRRRRRRRSRAAAALSASWPE